MMKLSRFILGLGLYILLFAASLSAQITSTTSTGQTRTPEAVKTQEAVNSVLDSSGRLFKEGLVAFKDNRRSDAGDKFNRSVEVFLYSALNIHRDPRLQGCYNLLIETIYRIEFPSDVYSANIQGLTTTCGWNIDNKLADDIAKLSMPSKVKSPSDKATKAAVVSGGNIPTDKPSIGFNDQSFEPSPLNDLAKLELSADEQQVDAQPQTKGKPTVPVKGITASAGSYSRPGSTVKPSSPVRPIVTVKARIGDTVQKIAARYGVRPKEVADLNELQIGSMLVEGREIKIPDTRSELLKGLADTNKRIAEGTLTKLPSGPKPLQGKDGKVRLVINYLNEMLHDPYSIRFVQWSTLTKSPSASGDYWKVTVKYRAKNLFGAYVLTEQTFYIRDNKVRFSI